MASTEPSRLTDTSVGDELDSLDDDLPTRATHLDPAGNSRFFLPIMLGLMIIGLLWVVIYYLSNEKLPIASIGRWNLGIGFIFMLAGFGMTTRWQ